MLEKKNSAVSSGKQKSGLSHIYLIFYNLAQTIGWTIVFLKTIGYYVYNTSDASLYDTVKCTLFIFQNLAILEVFHAIFRIVSSSPIITIQQISSRVIVVCGVLLVTENARESIGLPFLLFAWSITEIIRYANYTLNLLNAVPYILVWLRYSTFTVLYPLGVTGELLCMYCAKQETLETGMWSISMPNQFNVIFSYSYFLLFVMLLYIPLFPQLYLHMISQRKKVIGGQKNKVN